MSYTSLPTRGPTDLQAAITDVRAPAANELSADSIEAIKDRIIEIGTSLGIDAGTTAGSVREILGAAKSSGQWAHLRTGSSNVLVRHNFAASGAPTTGDDTGDGYAVGSVWIDPAAGIWICFDATAAAALWIQLAIALRVINGTAPIRIDGGASGNLTANRTISVEAATTSAAGVSELATSAEAFTGTDTDRAITPKALADTLQPAGRSVSGTTDTTVAGDIGNVVLYSQAGGVTVSLPDLSASLISGRSLVLTFQGTNAATVITVDPGAGVTIDGSASNYVATTGKARVSLLSLDGLAWYSGTP